MKLQLSRRGASQCGTRWMTLLLAGHLLSASHFLLSQADNMPVAITVEPWLPTAGKEATLIPVGKMQGIVFCSWFHGEMSRRNQILTYQLLPLPGHRHGPAYTGRETINPDCSLHIVNLTYLDTGYYSIQKQKNTTEAPEMGKTFLLVGGEGPPAPQKILTAKATAGTVVGCLFGVMFLIVVVVYPTLRTTERNVVDPATLTWS